MPLQRDGLLATDDRKTGFRASDRAAIDVDDDDYEGTDGIDFRLLETDEDGIPAALDAGPIPGVAAPARPLDVARLEGVLQELIACRQLLDSALKEG